MNSLLSVPLLPEHKVQTVLISYDYPKIIHVLNSSFHINTLEVKRNQNLDTPVSTHADCICVQLNKNTIFTESTNFKNIVNYLTNIKGELSEEIKIIEIHEKVKSPYPHDVRLNIKVISDSIICNNNYVADEIKAFAQESDMKIIHTNQGYSACSSIVISDKALITDDESIYVSSKSNGIDTLLISKGSVILDGYDYGFIGGTCGMIDKNLLAFTGKLNTHNDFDKIITFLDKYNVSYVELTNEPLIDIGGIIPILE